jgi:hypothetical protein
MPLRLDRSKSRRGFAVGEHTGAASAGTTGRCGIDGKIVVVFEPKVAWALTLEDYFRRSAFVVASSSSSVRFLEMTGLGVVVERGATGFEVLKFIVEMQWSIHESRSIIGQMMPVYGVPGNSSSVEDRPH